MRTDILRIGDLASRISVNPEAIRYYERRGLLPRPTRSSNGYRVYTAEHLERVLFIKEVQALGFSLEEIQEVMNLKFNRGVSPCQHVRDLLREKLDAVDCQISRLQAFRLELAESLKACENSLTHHSTSARSCPVLEDLNIRRSERRNKS